MDDPGHVDIASAIEEIEKKQREGFSTLEAIVIGLTKGFQSCGTAILTHSEMNENPKFHTQHIAKELFENTGEFLQELPLVLRDNEPITGTIWHSKLPNNRRRKTVYFLGRFICDKNGNSIGCLLSWNDRPFEHTDQTLNYLSLIGLSVNTHFEKHGQYSPEVNDISEAFEAISDGMILYDQDNRVLAFNGKQQELFPSFSENLKIGATYEDLLWQQVASRQISDAVGREEEWVNERKIIQQQHNYSTEQSFENGQTMRLTNYRTKSGGAVAVRTDITELVQAREKSTKNEKQLHDIIELSPNAIIVQAQGRLVYFNQKAVELFGAKDGAELLATPPLSLAHPDYRDLILNYRERVAAGEIPFARFETRHFRMDGSEFHSEMNVGAVSWKDQPGTVNIIRNITAQKENEAITRRRDEESRLAQKLGRIGHWRLNLETNQLEWSDELFRIYGLDKNTVKITPEIAHSMKPLEDVDSFNEMISDLLQGKPAIDFDYRIIREDGEIRHLRGNINPDYDAKGKVVSVFGVSQDITNQKEVERALDDSNQRFKDLAELGADWFWEMGTDFKYSYFSDKIHRITGVDTDFYLGKSRLEVGQTAFDEDQWEPHLKDMANHLPFKNFRHVYTNETGKEFHWQVSGKPVFDADGTFTGYRGSGTDITTQALMEEKLSQSQKMEAVGQLTGGVAHDFNNLLGVIQGNAELLLETADHLSDMEKNHLEVILKSTNRGAELTQSMLAFSRKQALVPKSIHLDEQIRNMTNILQRTLGEDISIRISHGEDLWACTADPGQLENALLNLSLNARDAMPGGGTLSISTSNVLLDDEYTKALTGLSPGKYLMLSVSDTGTGISQSDREHVFEPFFTTKEVGEGTGLGLSMVYGFAKQSGGHASIYSEEGHGTTVKIYLPQSDHVTSETNRINILDIQSQGETILVVEDDPDLRSLTVAMLENMGYQVTSATDATTALAILDNIEKLDVLLSDVVLPGGVNGVELSQKIKMLKPDISVLFMSGYTEDAFTQNGLLSEEAILLQKPFRRADLADKLRTVLSAS